MSKIGIRVVDGKRWPKITWSRWFLSTVGIADTVVLLQIVYMSTDFILLLSVFHRAFIHRYQLT